MTYTVAVIGSFKQHNHPIQLACQLLKKSGHTVTSPVGSEIIEENIDFVRFTSDPADYTDPEIQSLALQRIFSADIVYVVAPGGYVGRTTCYEIGRVLQRKQPIYFSETPKDLPIAVPEKFVKPIENFMSDLASPSWIPQWIFLNDEQRSSAIERDLVMRAL